MGWLIWIDSLVDSYMLQIDSCVMRFRIGQVPQSTDLIVQ